MGGQSLTTTELAYDDRENGASALLGGCRAGHRVLWCGGRLLAAL